MSKITIEELSDSLKIYLQNQAGNLAHEAENRAIQQAELRLDEQFAKTENTSYETINGYKEFKCEDGYVDNIYMEGKTLVNVIPKNANYVGNGWGTGQGTVDRGSNNDYIKIQHTSGGNEYVAYPDANPMIKAGVEYTLIVDVMEMTSHGSYEIFYIAEEAQHLLAGNTVQRIAFKFTPKYGGGYIRFDADLLATVKFSNPILLEGDYTAIADSISYFDGAMSLGQNDKIEILTREKNNSNLLKAQNITYKDNYIQNYTGTESQSSNHKYTETYIEIEPNTLYCFYHVSRNICWYDSNKTRISALLDERVIGNNANKDLFYVAKSPQNAKYLRVTIIKNIHNNGETSEIYKGKYDKKQIVTSLRSIPNGVCDTIEKHGDKYYLIQRCGSYIISNNDGYSNGTIKTNCCDHCIHIPGMKTIGSINANGQDNNMKLNVSKQTQQ